MVKIEKKVILLAIIIRLFVMPWTYHPDTKTQHFHFQFLKQGVFNIYDYIQNNKPKLPYQDTFNYLPLTYLTFGSTQFILSPILGKDFYNWINDWSSTQNNNPSLSFYLFVLKIPYLIIDLLTGYFLYKTYKNKKIVYIWLFNPLSIYLIYILANFDIVPAFLTLLSIYFFKEKKYLATYISIGIAIALKMYPLIFLPIFVLYNRKDMAKQIIYSALSFVPLLLSALPFMFSSSFSQAFIGSGLTQKIIEFKIFSVPLFPVFYTLILSNLFFSKSVNKIEIAITQMMLIFLGLVNFHSQWILWFLPLVIFMFQKIDIKTITVVTIFTLCLLYILLTNDNYLFWGHLIPIDPEFVNQRSPYQLLNLKFHLQSEKIQTIIHYLILFLGGALSLSYVKKNN